METNIIYPGTFSPPTYGHLYVLKKAAALFPSVTVVCSTNSRKDPWFTQQEAKRLWRGYPLPDNVNVLTFDEFISSGINAKSIVMIRGIRNDGDFIHENEVVALNWKKFGIDKYFYLCSPPELIGTSSSRARELARNLDLRELSGFVSPLITTALLEKALDLEQLFMVVGRPGSGKSTLLRELSSIDSRNVHVNTDDFNELLKPHLIEKFGRDDLIRLAIERPEELKQAIAGPWIELLKKVLARTPARSRLFLEVPYGLAADKPIYRLAGGKIIFVGCSGKTENLRRTIERGTPEIAPFIELIPDWTDTYAICREHRLDLTRIITDFSPAHLPQFARSFNQHLDKGGISWKVYTLISCSDI